MCIHISCHICISRPEAIMLEVPTVSLPERNQNFPTRPPHNFNTQQLIQMIMSQLHVPPLLSFSHLLINLLHCMHCQFYIKKYFLCAHNTLLHTWIICSTWVYNSLDDLSVFPLCSWGNWVSEIQWAAQGVVPGMRMLTPQHSLMFEYLVLSWWNCLGWNRRHGLVEEMCG